MTTQQYKADSRGDTALETLTLLWFASCTHMRRKHYNPGGGHQIKKQDGCPPPKFTDCCRGSGWEQLFEVTENKSRGKSQQMALTWGIPNAGHQTSSAPGATWRDHGLPFLAFDLHIGAPSSWLSTVPLIQSPQLSDREGLDWPFGPT